MSGSKIISVVVVTYQSANTIEETLQSIIEQDYGSNNIELIISDDCSQDTTLEIINQWKNKNYDKFNDVILLTSKCNAGTVSNLDRALRISSGDWIKTIAGDDILLPHCISTYVQYVENIKSCRVLFSSMQSFKDVNGERVVMKDVFPDKIQKDILKSECSIQKKFLNFSCFSVAPTTFIQKKLLEEINYLDKSYKLLEDYPLWLRIVEYDVALEYIDFVTVLYRIGNSTSRSNEKIINSELLKDLLRVEQEIIKNGTVDFLGLLRKKVWVLAYPKLIAMLSNKRNLISKWVVFIFNSFFKIGYLSMIFRKVRG